MRKDGAAEAKQAVAKAVEISRRVGTLIRYALTCQAEVARKTNDSALFASTLRELIDDAPNARQEDAGLDSAIIEKLPPSFCPPELEQQYLNALQKYR
jgi:hypothetical protein